MPSNSLVFVVAVVASVGLLTAGCDGSHLPDFHSAAEQSVPAPSAPAPDTLDVVHFLRTLHEVDRMPLLSNSTSELAAPWDRSGGKWDGVDYRLVEGDTNVLLRIDGPGCIQRISTGLLAHYVEGTHLVIELDHEVLVDVSVNEFFDPAHGPFAGPLTHFGTYPTVRMPIPFAEHAEVRLVSPDQKWGMFWQVGYTLHPGATVETLELPLGVEAKREFDRAGQAFVDATKPLGGPPEPTAEVIDGELAPNATLEWTRDGCGILRAMRARVLPNDPAAWRAVRLEVFWDGEDEAAIDASLADLMLGVGYGDDPEAEFNSLVAGAAGGDAYLRLPMPFRSGAAVRVSNTGERPVSILLDPALEHCGETMADMGYLHAVVAQSHAAEPGSPTSGPEDVPVHVLLDREGRGKIVGTVLRVDWPHEKLWWGEGDWQIWVDQDPNEWPPRYHGTGTEEWFDSGWTTFDRKALAGQVKRRPGLVTVYAWLTNDAVQFQERVRLQVETVGLLEGADVVVRDHPTWRSTTYFYADQP